jgi:hypothetical protein
MNVDLEDYKMKSEHRMVKIKTDFNEARIKLCQQVESE